MIGFRAQGVSDVAGRFRPFRNQHLDTGRLHDFSPRAERTRACNRQLRRSKSTANPKRVVSGRGLMGTACTLPSGLRNLFVASMCCYQTSPEMMTAAWLYELVRSSKLWPQLLNGVSVGCFQKVRGGNQNLTLRGSSIPWLAPDFHKPSLI